MEIKVCSNQNHFNETAAQLVARQIKDKPDTVLGLATGSTPVGLYRKLITMYKDNQLDFKDVSTFNLDEYVGISKDHQESYYAFMYRNLFNDINIPRPNINIPNGEADNLESECKTYEGRIEAAGGIDLQVLGIGHNGHIGFNEPGTPFESITHVVDLTQRTIEANSRFFESPDQVPRQALSMGIKTIMHAKKILLMVSGADKSEIVSRALQGPVTTDVPASILQLHPNVVVILDQDAASNI